MLEKLIELLTAIAVAAVGLGVANERAADHDDNGIGWTIAEERAALDAAGFGLATAAEARATAGRSGDDERADEEEPAVDGRAHAVEVLTEVAGNAPDQAQAGLATAITAVSGGGGAPTQAMTGAPEDVPVVTQVPAQVPAHVPAAVPAPPVTVAPPTVTPPVNVNAGPPADAPGGGNRP